MTKTNIIINLQVDGTHFWPGVVEHDELKPVHFLYHPHRHIFHIQAKKRVSHSDRDIEIITLKRNIQEYLSQHYFNEELQTHEFKTMSCEMIANMLVKIFELDYCSVLEDGENGGEVYVDEMPVTEIPKQHKMTASGNVSTTGKSQFKMLFDEAK